MLEIKFDNVAIDSNGIKGLSNTYELYKDNFYLGAVASNTFKLEVAKHLMPSKPTEVKIEDDNNNYVLEVDKIEETDNSYEIELTDKMLRFNFLYDAKPLIDENRVDGESTTTIQDILNDICEKADIECNYTLTTANHIVDWWDNRISARDYISMIAEKEATFVRFENDELMFIPVNSPSKKTINEDEIDELKIGEGRKITRVVYDNGVGTFWEFGDESGNTLYLDPNNVFILDENDVEDIYNKIKDFEFYSITVGNCPIDSSVLAGDVIKFKDRNDNEYPTIAQYNLSYFGKWLGGYSLDIKSTTQEETSVLGVFDSVKSIRTEIDRTNNELKIIAEEVGENSSKITAVEQTVEGVTTKIEEIDEIEERTTTIEENIDGLKVGISSIGGTNLIKNSVGHYQGDWENKHDGFTNTEIKNNTVSGHCFLIGNKHSTQVIQVQNGTYTIGFKYKKLLELAEVKIKVNDHVIELTETDWTTGNYTFEVLSNVITVELIGDNDNSCYLSDLMINQGILAHVWSSASGESINGGVKIGSSIEIESSVSNIKQIMDNDGNRIKNISTNETVAEFTDKGMNSKEIKTEKAEIARVVIQDVGNSTWLTRI